MINLIDNELVLAEAILSLHRPIHRADGTLEGYGECFLSGIKEIRLVDSGHRDAIEIKFADGSFQTFTQDFANVESRDLGR
tara:strand:+ start:822 stop:1064 length:243 start_codon:yes stop_codon:yes gene_type:complete